MTLLSIIIPVFNSEETIERTLDSLKVISPTSSEAVEVFVIDDGSTDSSVSLCEEKAKELRPLKLHIHKKENNGVSSARNLGLKLAGGEWILLLDADDELALDPVPYIKENPQATSLAFPVAFIKDGRVRSTRRPRRITEKNHLDTFTSRNALTISSIIFKREANTRDFDTECRFLEDWLFWIENPKIFKDMRLVKRKVLSRIHVHGKNRSSEYKSAGRFRTQIAKRLLTGLSLTIRQYNNLRIQAAIGSIMEGKGSPLSAFTFFPSSISLYGKLLIYKALKHRFGKLDLYGS